MIQIDLHKELQAANGKLYLDVNLSIAQGSFTSLYGKSGVGKTSILRMLAGLMKPDHGTISVANQLWFNSSKGIHLIPQKRKIGYVFQDYALFPNMTVEENLSFAQAKHQEKSLINQLIDMMELGALKTRKPRNLSGGQQQRVALARALVQQPTILLLDEPLSALDQEMRVKLQNYILKAHQELGLTTILVSHNVAEIMKLADQVIQLEDGKVMKQGSPAEVLSHQEISGKFQFTGELINLEKQGFLYILTILIGKDLVRVIADEHEAELLQIGDIVLVASKAFNPIIKKIS